jgi:hypothetical protein
MYPPRIPRSVPEKRGETKTRCVFHHVDRDVHKVIFEKPRHKHNDCSFLSPSDLHEIENSRERNPFWEANICWAIQNNTLLLRNANIRCCVQESLTLDPFLSHMDRVRTSHSIQVFNIYFKIAIWVYWVVPSSVSRGILRSFCFTCSLWGPLPSYPYNFVFYTAESTNTLNSSNS